MLQFCTNCGAELTPKARFCVACGKPVEYAAITAPTKEEGKAKEVSQPPAPEKKPLHFGVSLVGVLLIAAGGALAGGFFYFSTYRPELVASVKAMLFGVSVEQAATQAPSLVAPAGGGMTTGQIRVSWAEQALAEGRFKDADEHLKQAETIEPNSPAIQAVRARLIETEAATKRAEEERRQKEAQDRQREIEDRARRASKEQEERRSRTTIQTVTANVKDAEHFEIISKTFNAEPAAVWSAVLAMLRRQGETIDKLDSDVWAVSTQARQFSRGWTRYFVRYFLVVKRDGDAATVSIRPFVYNMAAMGRAFAPVPVSDQATYATALFKLIQEELGRRV